MGKLTTGVAVLIGLAMILFTVSQAGYGQNSTNQCQPFQRTILHEIAAGGSGTLRVTSGTSVTIETVGVKIDTTNSVVPTLASVTTSVGGVRTAYNLPMPIDIVVVGQYRPLTLLAPVRLYADGGTDITVAMAVDARYATGTGRAEWSVSGLSCAR